MVFFPPKIDKICCTIIWQVRVSWKTKEFYYKKHHLGRSLLIGQESSNWWRFAVPFFSEGLDWIHKQRKSQTVRFFVIYPIYLTGFFLLFTLKNYAYVCVFVILRKTSTNELIPSCNLYIKLKSFGHIINNQNSGTLFDQKHYNQISKHLVTVYLAVSHSYKLGKITYTIWSQIYSIIKICLNSLQQLHTL